MTYVLRNVDQKDDLGANLLGLQSIMLPIFDQNYNCKNNFTFQKIKTTCFNFNLGLSVKSISAFLSVNASAFKVHNFITYTP